MSGAEWFIPEKPQPCGCGSVSNFGRSWLTPSRNRQAAVFQFAISDALH
jgi:hypothetical protein